MKITVEMHLVSQYSSYPLVLILFGTTIPTFSCNLKFLLFLLLLFVCNLLEYDISQGKSTRVRLASEYYSRAAGSVVIEATQYTAWFHQTLQERNDYASEVAMYPCSLSK